MVDSAKDYNKLVEESVKEFTRGVEEFQPQIPTYSPQAKPLSRDEERHDYQTTKLTPGAFEQRLQEGKRKFGLVRAVEDILDWAIRNE